MRLWLIFAAVIFGSRALLASEDAGVTNIIEGCENHRADIYVLLESSSALWIVDYDKHLDFIVSFINRLHIHPNATRVGLGIFSDQFRPVIDIGGYPDKDTLIRTITQAPYLSGNRHTDKGLHGLRTVGFRPEVVRPNATKIGVVLTDGRSRYRSNTLYQARLAREDNIWLFAIGVGSSVDREELSTFASLPRDQFIFHVASLDDLSMLTDTLAKRVCRLSNLDSGACAGETKTDVMFVYNAASMRPHDVSTVHEFVRRVVSEFGTTSNNVRVGVISEGCQGGDIELGQFLWNEDFIKALTDLPKAKLAPLLKKLRSRSYGIDYEGRRATVKMAVVFVNNVMVSRDDVMYEALLLEYYDVLVHVIAIGSNYDMSEVKLVATSENHITQLATYDDLLEEKTITYFLDIFCQRKTSSAPYVTVTSSLERRLTSSDNSTMSSAAAHQSSTPASVGVMTSITAPTVSPTALTTPPVSNTSSHVLTSSPPANHSPSALRSSGGPEESLAAASLSASAPVPFNMLMQPVVQTLWMALHFIFVCP